jgi:hypothetical protein
MIRAVDETDVAERFFIILLDDISPNRLLVS